MVLLVALKRIIADNWVVAVIVEVFSSRCVAGVGWQDGSLQVYARDMAQEAE